MSYMFLYDTVQTNLLASRNKGRPSKQQKIVEMRAIEGGAEVSSDLPDNRPEAVYIDAKEVISGFPDWGAEGYPVLPGSN